MTGAERYTGSLQDRGAALWGGAVLVWLGLSMTVAAGRSFNAGPWRVYAVAVAAAVGLALTARRALSPPFADMSRGDAISLWRPAPVLACIAFAAVIAGALGGLRDPGHAGLAATTWGWLACGAAVATLGFGRVARPAERRGFTVADGLGGAAAAALVGLHAVAILAEPVPAIDVYDHMVRAGAVLLDGGNPYSTPVPDFYGGQRAYGFATPGFPYPPAVLALVSVASAVGLDPRWLLLACVVAGAALVRGVALRRGWSRQVAALLGVLYLAVPRLSPVLTAAYSEPLSGVLFTGALVAWTGGRRSLAFVLLGLFATSKQYLVVAAPLFVLSCASPAEVAWLAVGAVSPWLPFLAWDAGALWSAGFLTHLGRPARPDGITWTAWRLARGADPLPAWVPLLAGAAAGMVGAFPRPPRPMAVCLALASALTLTLFLGPQAFSNYYVLTSWVLIGAVATLRAAPAPGEAGPLDAPSRAERGAASGDAS